MKVFYHSDADGKCAGSIVAQFHPDADFIAIDFTDEFPIETIGPHEVVFILDYSIEPDMMLRLLDVTRYVIWIDHHRSAIDKYTARGMTEIAGVRSTDAAGCSLTWLYFDMRNRRIWPESASLHDAEFHVTAFDMCPFRIKLIGDRDTWTFEYGDKAKYLHESFMLNGEPGPLSSWWIELGNTPESLDKCLHEGSIALNVTASMYRRISDSAAFETDFDGHLILACNVPVYTSELFGDRVKDYPFVAITAFKGGKWKTSLYSVNMDVVHLAVARGGGGHPRACGFVSDSFPFSQGKV